MSGHFQYLPIQNWLKAAEHKPKHLPIFLLDAYQSVIGKGIRCVCSVTGKTCLMKLRSILSLSFLKAEPEVNISSKV